MLSAKDLVFSYGSKKVLKGVNFTIAAGEIVSLIGTSGSGKTTLFRLIAGLLKPESGEIRNAGELSYMRQEDLLLPWRTTLQNLLLFSELGKRKVISKESALKRLKEVGLEGSEELYPHELSGGMRQRLSLARSLLQNHPLLLLDEPFGSLDLILRGELYTLLHHLAKVEKKTILLITHDFRDALTLSDRILVLGEGVIKKEFSITENLRKNPVAKENLLDEIKLQLLRPATH